MSSNILIPAEVYSRVSGYFRPVNQWNKGKQEEFSGRLMANVHTLSAAMECSSSDCFNSAVSTS